MRVLLVNGSPHAEGCTYTALQEVARALNGEEIETEIFHIGTKPISGCIACRQCGELGKCAIQDAVNEFGTDSDTLYRVSHDRRGELAVGVVDRAATKEGAQQRADGGQQEEDQKYMPERDLTRFFWVSIEYVLQHGFSLLSHKRGYAKLIG